MSLISIGVSGLSASKTALTVTGNNIANVATAGYSRQSATSAAAALQNIGVGFIGTGTTISDVRRIYNSFMDTQLQTTTALSSDAKAYGTEVASIDSLLADSSTGISSVLSSFFSSLQTASASPSDTSSRQLLMTSAQTLSNRFNSIASQLNTQNDSINSQLSTLAGQVNQLTSSIASLNQQITQLSATGSPNTLLDARNEAVRSLNELVGVTVQQRGDNYDVYLGSGQSLVTGSNAYTLSASPSTADTSQYALKLDYQNSTTDVTSVVSGGQIGGLLRARSDVIIPALNELGRVALVVSDSINKQLGQGVDNNGDFGSSLFANINSDTAMTARSLASSNNASTSGNLKVAIADSSALTIYDYQVKFTTATSYSVTRSDGTSMGTFSSAVGSTPASFDGITITPPTSNTAGDSFNVIPTRTGASSINTALTDSSKLAFSGALTGIATTGNTGTGSMTQPVLTTSLDIYNSAALADQQVGIENSMPVKLVMGEAGGSTQTYQLFDSKGSPIASGTVVPGQDNTLKFSVGMVDATGAAIVDANGDQKTFNFQTTINGSPATNDSFTFSFNSDGKSDNRNATALLTLQTSATVGATAGNKGISFTSAYASLVETIGAKAAQATVDTSATGAILQTAKDNRDSVSGVNLDDEAAALVKFQQYYQASSQIIKTAQETFTTLLNAL